MIVNKYFNGGGGGSGERGPQGYQGPEGPQGPQGANGQDGADGKDGLDGQTGPQGVEGAQGPQGIEGQVGPQGPQGPAGSGGTGDNFILKSSSGTPENIGAGDVFATHEDAEDPVYGDSWDDTGYQTLTFEDAIGYHPQAIRIEYTDWVYFSFGFNNAGWHDGLGFNIDNGTFNVSDYDHNRWDVSPTHIVFKAQEWMEKTDGKTVYLDIVGQYLYIYTDGTDKIWLNDVSDNMMNNVYVGEVIPAHGDIDKVFQANVKSEPNVKIELEGNARIDGTLDDPEQVVTMSDGQMKISFYDPSSIEGKVCDLESYGTYFELNYAALDDTWVLFDSDGENVLIKITDGESDSADFGGGNVYLSYSGGVLTAYTDNEKGWKNWEMGDTHEIVTAQELAKVSDLPAKKQLLPQGWNAAEVLMSNGSEETPIWFGRGSLIVDGMREAYDYQEGNGPMVLERENFWDIGWKKLDKTVLNAKDELPVQGEDGAVYALSSSGYGIYQAQSAHTGYEWFNLVDKTFPQGVVTKIRVPYNDNGESNICHFKTDPNGSGEWNLYWHPENTDDRHWDGVPDGYSQNDGEFNAVDQWGNTAVATKVGNYIEITFGAPLYDGDEQISTYRNTEVYTEGDITDYRRVAFYDEISGGGGGGAQGPQGPQGAQGPQGPMPSGAVTSSTITTIWSGSQSDYNNLGTYDNNTFYVII